MFKKQQRFVLIGAGPSLDSCRHEIADLHAEGTYFLISDSVAAGVLRIFPKLPATVFTVELRRHLYLARIGRISPVAVMAYQKAHERNLRLTGAQKVSHFKILHEEGDLPEFYSPGTVLGIMLAFAVKSLAVSGGEIHILGADFSYIDNQVYSRFIYPHAPPAGRLTSPEKWQYEMALKKSGGVIVRNGHAVRTGFELMQARENMREFVSRLPEAIRVFEYSPMGFDAPPVQKKIPQMHNI